MARSLPTMYGSGLTALAERARDLQGQPVRSALSIDAGVEWTPSQQAQVQQAKADADKRKAEARTEEQKQSAGAGANAASSLAHGNLGGAVSGVLGRRASSTAEQNMESSMGSGSDAGSGRPMTIVTDVLSVSTGASGASFEPPAGYRKVVREEKQPACVRDVASRFGAASEPRGTARRPVVPSRGEAAERS